MRNVGDRLDLAWGGPITQQIQRDVIAALDDLIREPPPAPPSPPAPPGTPVPPGPPRPGPWSPDPGDDGPRPPVTGKGIVADKDLGRKAPYGSLPEKDRTSARIQ